MYTSLFDTFFSDSLIAPSRTVYVVSDSQLEELKLNQRQRELDNIEDSRRRLEDSYQAHVGFQQLPIKKNSVNWIGISPTAGDYGKAIEWFTGTEDGMAFGELYQSVYSCDTSFMTFVTASSN